MPPVRRHDCDGPRRRKSRLLRTVPNPHQQGGLLKARRMRRVRRCVFGAQPVRPLLLRHVPRKGVRAPRPARAAAASPPSARRDGRVPRMRQKIQGAHPHRQVLLGRVPKAGLHARPPLPRAPPRAGKGRVPLVRKGVCGRGEGRNAPRVLLARVPRGRQARKDARVHAQVPCRPRKARLPYSARHRGRGGQAQGCEDGLSPGPAAAAPGGFIPCTASL